MRGVKVDHQEVELITKLVYDLLKKEDEDSFLVPVGVSARHIHLTQTDVETLFGEGYQLTKKKELMG